MSTLRDTRLSARRGTRLDVRLPEENKRLIEQAASYLGQSVSAFTVATLLREAGEVIERFGHLRLSDRDRDAFLAALETPPAPNSKLRDAAKRHTKFIR